MHTYKHYMYKQACLLENNSRNESSVINNRNWPKAVCQLPELFKFPVFHSQLPKNIHNNLMFVCKSQQRFLSSLIK